MDKFGHGQLSNTQHYEYQIHCTRQIQWTYDRYLDWTYDQYSKKSRQGQIDRHQPKDRQRRHRQVNGHLSISYISRLKDTWTNDQPPTGKDIWPMTDRYLVSIHNKGGHPHYAALDDKGGC